MDKTLILNRIKEAFDLKGNTDLARFLGIAPNTVTNWYNRNSVDYDLIFTKCEKVNFEWLIKGKRQKSDAPPSNDVEIAKLRQLLTERERQIAELQTEVGLQLRKVVEKDEQLHKTKDELLKYKDKVIALLTQQQASTAAPEWGKVGRKDASNAKERKLVENDTL
jgi:transcriptional regulator with XRE-family HTH domain